MHYGWTCSIDMVLRRPAQSSFRARGARVQARNIALVTQDRAVSPIIMH